MTKGREGWAAWPPTNGTGQEVDPGGLDLDVKPVTVGHQQPCGEDAVTTTVAWPWESTVTGVAAPSPHFSMSPWLCQYHRDPQGSIRPWRMGTEKTHTPLGSSGKPGRCGHTACSTPEATLATDPSSTPCMGFMSRGPPAGPAPRARPTPGTKMSPKPRREKGRSHRDSGEVLSLGTFSTMGSCGESRAQLGGSRQHLCQSPQPEACRAGGLPSRGWMSSRAQWPPPP